MKDLQNGRQRQDRHSRRKLILDEPNPKCSKCGLDKIPALQRAKSGDILCANCKRGYEPLSASAHTRKLAKFAKAGCSNPICATCGETCLRVLILHHIGGEANSELQTPLCENCHAVQSDYQQDFSKDPDLLRRDDNRDPHLKQAAVLQGVAILFTVLAIVFFAWSQWNRIAARDLAATYGPNYWNVISMEAPR
jgi:hypothetical protein